MPRQMKITDDELRKEYVVNQKSTHVIADEYSMHPETVRRRLIRLEIELRSHSEAQSMYCEKYGSPVAGRPRTEGEKEAIARNLTKHWENLTQAERKKKKKKISKRSKKMWREMDENDRAEKMDNLNRHRLAASATGSRSERELAIILEERGYDVETKTHKYTAGQFEIDICLPDESIAIEVDGPTHFEPIYGDDRLERVKQKDALKNATLKEAGFVVIRAANKNPNYKKYWCLAMADKIEKIINIGNKNPRVIKLEV